MQLIRNYIKLNTPYESKGRHPNTQNRTKSFFSRYYLTTGNASETKDISFLCYVNGN
jgi:hypothetical protein